MRLRSANAQSINKSFLFCLISLVLLSGEAEIPSDKDTPTNTNHIVCSESWWGWFRNDWDVFFLGPYQFTSFRGNFYLGLALRANVLYWKDDDTKRQRKNNTNGNLCGGEQLMLLLDIQINEHLYFYHFVLDYSSICCCFLSVIMVSCSSVSYRFNFSSFDRERERAFEINLFVPINTLFWWDNEPQWTSKAAWIWLSFRRNASNWEKWRYSSQVKHLHKQKRFS